MGIKKVDENTLYFVCSGTTPEGACGREREIPIADLEAFVNEEEGLRAIVLPLCECGARSLVMPSLTNEAPQHHARRSLWKRVASKGKKAKGTTKKQIDDATAQIQAFYDDDKHADLKAEYESDDAAIEAHPKQDAKVEPKKKKPEKKKGKGLD